LYFAQWHQVRNKKTTPLLIKRRGNSFKEVTVNTFKLFLDIDGIVCTQRCTKDWIKVALPYGEYKYSNICWDEKAINEFLYFLAQLEAITPYEIILSSDWRWNNPEDHTRLLFDRYKIPQYTSITPIKSHTATHGIRSLEILEWLKENNVTDNKYLVIDDTSFIIKPHIDNKNFVFVNGGWNSGGFNHWHRKHALEKARKLLGIAS
jgi:hypothetical protein